MVWWFSISFLLIEIVLKRANSLNVLYLRLKINSPKRLTFSKLLAKILFLINKYINYKNSPGWVAQLIETSFSTPKRFQVRSLVRHVKKATNGCFSLTSMFLSLSLSLSLSLKSINITTGEDLKNCRIKREHFF